jgi:transcription elongation GreA/GreB family factor
MTIHDDSFYVTRIGLAAIRTRLEAARASFRAVCDDNPAARESGDSSVWHDNFAFEENQRLMHQLAHAVLVPALDATPRRAVIGARVTYRFADERTSRSCVLVGHGEGRPESRWVAYDSPLGASLLGAGIDDEVELVLGGRARIATIEHIDGCDFGALEQTASERPS